MIARIDSETLRRLEEEGKERGLSPRLLEFYGKLLGIQSAAEQHIGSISPALDKKVVDNCVESGIPLIKPDELNPDWSLLKDTFTKITATLADCPNLFAELGGKLKEPESVLRELAKTHSDLASPPETKFGSTNEQLLMKAIALATLKPFWVAHSKALIGFVSQERWRRGYCPICGGRADFAFLGVCPSNGWLAVGKRG